MFRSLSSSMIKSRAGRTFEGFLNFKYILLKFLKFLKLYYSHCHVIWGEFLSAASYIGNLKAKICIPRHVAVHLFTLRPVYISRYLCKLDKRGNSETWWLALMTIASDCLEGRTIQGNRTRREADQCGRDVAGPWWHILHTFFYPATTY